MKRGKQAGVYRLVVNLRCELCKQLFSWRPYDIVRAEHPPGTCSPRCMSLLRTWRTQVWERRKAG